MGIAVKKLGVDTRVEFAKTRLLMAPKILDRLKAGEVILGDGSYTITLEKRCYVLSNAWTPEAAVEHSDGVKELALEFARAGGDVTQTYTFFSDDQRLKEWHGPNVPCCSRINEVACKIAKDVAKEKSTITAGGIAMTDVYQTTRNKEKTMAELDTAMKALIENDIDMILCEYFRNIEEMEWALELVKKTTDKPCGATMCVGPNGDVDGVSLGECAVRMAKAGADLIGLNCLFGPFCHVGLHESHERSIGQGRFETTFNVSTFGISRSGCWTFRMDQYP